MLLGTVKASTLRLSIDNVGLDYTVELPETRSDTLELISRGDVSASSFGFLCFEDSWGYSDGSTHGYRAALTLLRA
jgi:phage head maturation protease